MTDALRETTKGLGSGGGSLGPEERRKADTAYHQERYEENGRKIAAYDKNQETIRSLTEALEEIAALPVNQSLVRRIEVEAVEMAREALKK